MKNKKDIIIFSILLLISILLCSQFLIGHYATDTYNIANQGFIKYGIEWNLKDGRIFLGLSCLLADALHIPIEIYVTLTLILAILISCLAILQLKNTILTYKPAKNKKVEFLIIAICYITIFNFMYVENLYFVECSFMAFSILMYILASKSLVEGKKYSIVKTFIYLLLGVFSYQGTVGFVFVTTLLFSLLANPKQYKITIKNIFCIAGISFITVILNLLQVNIVAQIIGIQQTRIHGFENIFNNIVAILTNMKTIFINTTGLFPKGLWISLVLLISIVAILKFCQLKDKNLILEYFLLILFTCASSFILFLMTLSSFETGRMHFCIGALIGILCIYIYGRTDLFETKGLILYSTLALLILYSITTYFGYFFQMYEHKKINQIEKQQVEQIEQYIQTYESNTKQQVTKIVPIIYNNATSQCYEDTIKSHSVLTYPATKCLWSYDGVIYFYTGRKLQQQYLNNDIKNQFLQTIPQETYFCKSNILFMKIYVY